MNTEPGRRPAYQFYPRDEERSPEIRTSSLAAYGLWKRMQNFMHFGQPYGHLTTASGEAFSLKELARAVGETPRVVERLLGELERANVFSLTESRVIYSRRMVKDERIRQLRSSVGKLGGNPKLRRDVGSPLGSGVVQDLPNQTSELDKQTSNQVLTPAVAVAVASATQITTTCAKLAAAANSGLAEHRSRPQTIPRILATSARTREAAEAILAAGVTVEFAEQAIYDAARSHVADGEVTSLKYFVAGVIRRWQEAAAAREAAAVEVSPLARDRREHRRCTLADIRALIRTEVKDGRTSRFIRIADVEAIGHAEFAAYRSIGGAERVLAVEGDSIRFLEREFSLALDRAERECATSAAGPGAGRDERRALAPTGAE